MMFIQEYDGSLSCGGEGVGGHRHLYSTRSAQLSFTCVDCSVFEKHKKKHAESSTLLLLAAGQELPEPNPAAYFPPHGNTAHKIARHGPSAPGTPSPASKASSRASAKDPVKECASRLHCHLFRATRKRAKFKLTQHSSAPTIPPQHHYTPMSLVNTCCRSWDCSAIELSEWSFYETRLCWIV
jgi:hypothetical protein